MHKSKKIDGLIVYAISITIISLTVDFIQGIFLNILLILNNLLILVYEIKINGTKVEKSSRNMSIMILSIVAIALVISILGINIIKSIETMVLFGGKILLLFLIIIFDHNKMENFNRFIKVFNFFVIACILYAVIIKFFGTTPQPYISQNGVSIYKQYLTIGNIQLSQFTMGKDINNHAVSSITGNPNAFSYLCAYATMINISLIKLRKIDNRKSKKYIIYLLLCIVGVILGGSRSAILAVAIYLIIYDFLEIKAKGKSYIQQRQVVIFFLAIFIVIAILFISQNMQTIKDVFSLNGREIVWNVFMQTFEKNPLFLSGIGNTIEVVRQELGYEMSLHNTYFTIIMELGLFLGTFFIMAQFGYIISSIKKIKKYQDNKDKELLILAIGVSIILLIQGCTEVFIITNNFISYIYFYLIFIQLILRGEKRNVESEKNKGKDN